ncbi:MAG: DUF2851 family protein, partial [Chthoniobacterales bacterium]|nr:DUF2851 family protein [Chthoniobacterales bacterium]
PAESIPDAIEVDLNPSGWEQHGHATNPDYEGVVLHVIVQHSTRRYFSRTAGNSEVPQVCLADHAPAEAEWDAIAPARPGRCLAPLRSLDSGSLLALLATAATRRIERKGALLETMIASRGADAALYEAIAITLGYKNNKLPFQLLAQRVPRRIAATPRGEAALFGISGFLERPAPPAGAARGTAARLWASWWKQRAACANSILPRTLWKLAGVRPANHPLRRVAALGVMARRWKSIRAALESADQERLHDALGALEHPFWSFHTTWNSPRHRKPLALLGPDRIRDIFANVALPLAVSRGHDPAWLGLPAAAPNAALAVVTTRLFGTPNPRVLPRKLFVQQGLLQIYRDFCLHDHSECAQCAFPGLVGQLSG